MTTAFLMLLLVLTPWQVTSKVSDAQKQEFIKLLHELPVKGEFYTDEAIRKATPYLPVLFALTEQDIKEYDVYPFFAISRGLCDAGAQREYAVRHFTEIRHSELKLFWGAMLFDSKNPSLEVVGFLKNALQADGQAELLSEIVGPKFDDFKRRVMAHRAVTESGKNHRKKL